MRGECARDRLPRDDLVVLVEPGVLVVVRDERALRKPRPEAGVGDVDPVDRGDPVDAVAAGAVGNVELADVGVVASVKEVEGVAALARGD